MTGLMAKFTLFNATILALAGFICPEGVNEVLSLMSPGIAAVLMLCYVCVVFAQLIDLTMVSEFVMKVVAKLLLAVLRFITGIVYYDIRDVIIQYNIRVTFTRSAKFRQKIQFFVVRSRILQSRISSRFPHLLFDPAPVLVRYL